jgi:outer membrane receptor protein involved in Fe transport
MTDLPPAARLRVLLLAALPGLAFTTANAQQRGAPVPVEEQSAESVQEIVVTGSRIVRAELTAASPIAVVNEDTIRLNNPINIEDLLRRSPQFAPAIGSQVNNGNEGAATLDLRNLGEERTLVLVDGKRFVPFDAQNFVDVNMIPVSLLERVEVVTGGASAVYGSDAVAGVVNFIMKKDFEGLEVNSTYGVTQEGDGENYGFDVTAGGNFGGGRGNVVVNVGYTKQDLVSQGDRDFSRRARNDLLDIEGSFIAEEATTFYQSFPGDAEFGCSQFDGAGDLASCSDPTSFNFNPFNTFQVPNQKWTATLLGRYDINDRVEFFTRGSFANSRTDTSIAPTGTQFFPFTINTDNPFLSSSARDLFTLVDTNECDEPVFDDDFNLVGCDQLASTAGDGLVTVELARRLSELGARDAEFENTAYQFVGGLRGEWATNQRFEAFAQYGRTARTQRFVNDARNDRVAQALVAGLDGDDNAFCFNPTDPGRTPIAGCVPIDILGPGRLDQAGQDYIRVDVNESNTVDQFVTGGSLGGSLPMTLPTAVTPLGYAVGIEYRKEQGSNRPDTIFQEGLAMGSGARSAIDAEIDIREVYGELLVPVVQDARYARAINLEAGVRYAQYENSTGGSSNDFNNTSFKLGGDWSPTDSLRLRAMFQRAVRAPNLREIGLPLTASTGNLGFDPCEGTNPLGNAALTQLCIDTGVPPARIGSVVSIVSGQVNNFVGGRTDLEPEEADTWTVGFVLQPTSIPGLAASVDYYRIKIDTGITQVAEQSVVNACYDPELNPTLAADNAYCRRLRRSPVGGGFQGGTDVGVDVSLINAAVETAEGIDFAAGYTFGLGSGELGFNLQATYVLEQARQDAAFLPENDCTGLVGEICLRPRNEWVGLLSTTWRSGPLTVLLDSRYLSPVTKDTVILDPLRADPDNPGEFIGTDPANFGKPKIGSHFYFDLRAQYDINETWTVRAGIRNLFDREPPVVGDFYGGTAENSGSTYPSVYDPLGRSFSVGATARF